MEYYFQKSIREGLKNWLYAIFYRYYHVHDVVFLEENVKEDSIDYTVNHANKQIKFKAKNIRSDLSKHLLVDYFISIDNKWQLFCNLYNADGDAVI